jgi:hypothetical protein
MAQAQSLRTLAGWSRRCCESKSPTTAPAQQPLPTVSMAVKRAPRWQRAGSGEDRCRAGLASDILGTSSQRGMRCPRTGPGVGCWST